MQRATMLLILAATSSLAAAEPELQRLKYNHRGLVVDLGVGLWAWPLPIDYDRDGDTDLLVSCPDKPSNGTYFFENTSPGELMPVFKPPVRVGPGFHNITVSYVDDQPRVMTPGRRAADLFGQGTEKWDTIYPRANIHTVGKKIRYNGWKQLDYDGDALLDLIVGVGDWSDYGWDDAYDSQGRWTNGPLHGYVYLIRNRGTNESPDYESPRQLEAGGKPIDVFGWPSPNFADFDNDGDLDLVCGEFLDHFSYFENIGSRQQPNYAAARRLHDDGGPLRMDLQMITPTAYDWDGDGDQDLIVGDEDGRVALVEHSGKVVNGLPQFRPPRYFQQQADHLKFGALATPTVVDYDSDGDQDILCGNTAGHIGLFENLGPADANDPHKLPKWAAPRLLAAGGKTIRIQAGSNGSIQGPCEAKWGYTTLTTGDWDGDGLFDVVVNSIWGRVMWYRNVGSRGEPRWDLPRPVEVQWNGKPPKPQWTWWEPVGNELVTQWRTTPVAVDYNSDQLTDLVMLDHEGYLCLFERKQAGDALLLTPPQRIFIDEAGNPLRLNDKRAGGSGRRKLCVVDFDGDGLLDLLANGENADWYRNMGSREAMVVLALRGPLDNRKLAGHTSSPTTADFDGDGKPNLLVGAEDGYLYYRH